MLRGTYTRWTKEAGSPVLTADILGASTLVRADPETGLVTARVPNEPLDPDTARMIGVRLIEAAALADDGRSVRDRSV